MNKHKQCLIILPRKIFPIVSGYSNHKKTAIEILNRYYILSVVLITDTQISDEELLFYKNNSSYFNITVIPRWRFLLNAFITVFSTLPIQMGYFYFKQVQHIINALLPNQDIVIGTLIRTMNYLKHTPQNCRIIFDMIDAVGLNYKQSFEGVTSIFWRLIYRIEINRLFSYEEYWVKRAHATMLFNKFEYDYWNVYGKVYLLPHGVKNELLFYNKTSTQYSGSVAFIGKMDYQPNIDAVCWYIKNVHSRIGNKVPFIIVGAYPVKEIMSLSKNNANITVTGYMEDPYVILNSCLAVIAPMQTGAGIQNKVLEAMALGTINVVTSLAAKPIIGAAHGEHFLIADTADAFCNTILDVFKSPEKYVLIKKSARNFISSHYTWRSYEHEYIKAIEDSFNE
jgi:glycosyltransferase involved in cell wall biosynthesis